MNALQTFAPRYLKPVDLNNAPFLVHIERVVTRDDVYDPVAQCLVTRHVLYLLHSNKGFMLNRTQTMAVVEATGQEDTDNWAGHSIIIQAVTSENGYPTIQVGAYEGQDPKEAGLHQFAPLPQRPMPTGQQVRQARMIPAQRPSSAPAAAVTAARSATTRRRNNQAAAQEAAA
jgi:hypothetical protein